MFIVKRKRGSSAKSSRSGSQQPHESDGSSHNSNPSLNSGQSVQLKSILKQESSVDDDTTPSKASSGNQPSTGGSQYSCRRVGFKHVQVREFERIIGDNPSCSSGAPVAIGWAYDKDRTMLLDDYEAARPPRKQLPQLVLTRQDREEILVEWGVSFNDIIDSIRANVKAKNQRRRTVSSLDRYDRFEEYMENASRRLKRTLLLKKTIRKQAEEMADQSTRNSRVTYVDRPPQQPQQQRLIDIPPRQPPRAPESPRPVLVPDLDMDGAMQKERHSNDIRHMLDNHIMEEHALFGHMMQQPDFDRRPQPLIEYDALDDFSSAYYDQNVPVQFIGGNDQPQQSQFYQQQQQTVQLQSLPLDVQQYLLQQMLQQQQLQQQQPQYDPGTVVMEDLTYDGDETDGFESLGQSYWDDGMDAPGLRRRMVAVIISEDGQYDADDGWDNGFTLQPPPHSNSIVSSWE